MEPLAFLCYVVYGHSDAAEHFTLSRNDQQHLIQHRLSVMALQLLSPTAVFSVVMHSFFFREGQTLNTGAVETT